jgi:hypothetical protein
MTSPRSPRKHGVSVKTRIRGEVKLVRPRRRQSLFTKGRGGGGGMAGDAPGPSLPGYCLIWPSVFYNYSIQCCIMLTLGLIFIATRYLAAY